MSSECAYCSEHCLECKCKLNHSYSSQIYEVFDILEPFNLGISLSKAIKHILLSGNKVDRIRDLKRAIIYIQREIDKGGSKQS